MHYYFRSLVEHRQTEEYSSFMKRAAKTIAAVSFSYIKYEEVNIYYIVINQLLNKVHKFY